MTPESDKPTTAEDEETKREATRGYQHDYYLRTRKTRLRERARRWKEDPDFRARELERARKERSEERRKRAANKFAEMVARKRAEAEKRDVDRKRPARRPRLIAFTGKKADLQPAYPSGTAALCIGRGGETLRGWLNEGVIPGASAFYGDKAYFTQGVIDAMYRACFRLYFEDGNGNLEVLTRLVREELYRLNEPLVEKPGARTRIVPKRDWSMPAGLRKKERARGA